MKVRRRKRVEASVAPRFDVIYNDAPSPLVHRVDYGRPSIEAVPFEGIVPLVTLEDPNADTEPARGAFVRLRPPEDLSASETSAWRDLVTPLAFAVRVVPRPRRSGLARPERETRRTPSDDVRVEATSLAVASGDPLVAELVEEILAGAES